MPFIHDPQTAMLAAGFVIGCAFSVVVLMAASLWADRKRRVPRSRAIRVLRDTNWDAPRGWRYAETDHD